MPVTPFDYASSQLRQAKTKRLRFHSSPKVLPVALNLGDRYFKPFDSSNRITVEHNRRINPNTDSFSHKFNQATDFYRDFVLKSNGAIIKQVEDLSGNGAISKPINIVKHQNLVTFFTIQGT